MAIARLIRYLAIAALPLMACAPLAANPAVTASYASPPTTVSGTATIINFVVTSTRSAGGITFLGYTNDVTYVDGDFHGMSHVTGVLTLHADGSGLFNETETFTGSVLGSTQGTFVEANQGTVNSDGTFQGRGVIKDGTGGLAGIHGVKTFQAMTPVIFTYSGHAAFDPS
jgi:Protein of unknown function (DUF3224)